MALSSKEVLVSLVDREHLLGVKSVALSVGQFVNIAGAVHKGGLVEDGDSHKRPELDYVCADFEIVLSCHRDEVKGSIHQNVAEPGVHGLEGHQEEEVRQDVLRCLQKRTVAMQGVVESCRDDRRQYTKAELYPEVAFLALALLQF